MRRRLVLALLALATLSRTGVAFAGGHGGGEEKKTTSSDSYLHIQTLTAFMMKPSGKRGVMTVDCGLDIPDGKLRERAQLVLPRIRAAFVQSVQVYAGGLPYGYPPNAQFLAQTLQRNTDQILGRSGARVLIGSVIVN